MSDQRLTQSSEKSKQRIARRESRPDSAPSFQGDPHPILQLQRTIGNRRVTELIHAKRLTPQGTILGLQRKLTVGAADDPYEQEADRVASQVMRMPEPTVQRTCAPCAVGGTLCSKCETEEKPLVQRRTELAADITETSVSDDFLQSLGSGSPLDAATRAFFEPRLGVDFSHVRVLTDSRAAESARAVNAVAYTVGRDVVFGTSQYAPTSPDGRKLLAHELAHVVQQGRGVQRAAKNLRGAVPSAPVEQDADDISKQVSHVIPFFTRSIEVAPTIARQVDAGVPDVEEGNRGMQVECVKRLGGCANTRPAGIPTPEEIASYNAQCRGETGYTGPDVTPTDEECGSSGPPPVTPTTVFMCSKDLERSPLGTHAFFRVGGTGTGHPTYSLEPENRGSDCWQGQPKRDFPADVNADALCELTSIALSCLDAQYAAYPIGHYCTWGPNSNTFVGHIARNCGMSNPDPPGWNPGIDVSPPPSGTFAPSPDNTLLGCETKECRL